jgi:starch synthase (maltosyl-transferring)
MSTVMPSAQQAPDAESRPQHGLAAGAAETRAAAALMLEGRLRAVIDAVLPVVDGGRFAAKRVVGKPIHVEAHCFADGHDRLAVLMEWGSLHGVRTHRVAMQERGNDVYTAEFIAPTPGRYRFTVTAWLDRFESWRRDLSRRDQPEDIRAAFLSGCALIDAAAARAPEGDSALLRSWSAELREGAGGPADPVALVPLALDGERAAVLARSAERGPTAAVSRELIVDRRRAAFGSWYEMFPRSAAAPDRHGTLRDVVERLSYIAGMGFDVLYLPPIHPIGRSHRKGMNNARTADPADVGSPWAIGAAEGGHKSILPQLGTLEDFRQLMDRARDHGLEIALDLAFQCSPDHPYVREHPSWFRHRPDGSVQYAENPPKAYQDIYPFDFESDDWQALWLELKSIVEFWIAQGVRIFRVDNPHTKPFAFWEWLIGEIKQDHPDVIFLAEAFTRPKVMQRLAKLGFSQSYTYFTWRNSKQELTEYFTELAHGGAADYFRPNLWPNTPDILHESLQSGLRPAFAARLILAATLAGNYGIYGPAFELLEHEPRAPGSEEYRDSEKYQLRRWRIDPTEGLQSLITRINRIRRENPALEAYESLRFCKVDNERLIAYLKTDVASDNVILTVVNLDPRDVQSGWLEFDPAPLELRPGEPFQMHDLLSDQRFVWRSGLNFVRLDPRRAPAHVFVLRRHLRSERDFDYFR